jgi:hypothetical protein
MSLNITCSGYKKLQQHLLQQLQLQQLTQQQRHYNYNNKLLVTMQGQTNFIGKYFDHCLDFITNWYMFFRCSVTLNRGLLWP